MDARQRIDDYGDREWPGLQAALTKVWRGAPYSVAAKFVGEITPNGMDGARWRLLVTDGRTFGYVDLDLSGTDGGAAGMEVDPAFIESEAEWMAGNFPRETRLADLLAASPLVIRRDQLSEAA